MYKQPYGLNVLISMILLVSSLHSAELGWDHDYNQALIRAKQEKKDLYVFIGADVCRFCDKYKETTLSDKEVMKTLTQDYIPVYLSRDRHQIPSHLETKGVPIHYFITAEGTIYFETRGALEIPGFYIMMDEAELNRDDTAE